MNIVVVILDTLRHDYALELPAFAKLAEQGWHLTRVYGGSTFTFPNLCTIRSGLYPIRHGWRTWPKADPFEAEYTLEGCLKKAGYHISTGMAVPPGNGTRVIERPKKEPFFRFVWYMGLHDDIIGLTYKMPAPGVPHEEYRKALPRANAFLERVLNQFGDCLLVVLGDHGVGLEGERLRGEGFDVGAGQIYDFRIRVQCVITGPEIEPRRIDKAISMADLMPTILGLLELPIPPGLDGVPLDEREGPMLLEAQSPHSIWPSDVPNVFGATDGKYKLMITPTEVLCFNLEDDPKERRPRPDLLPREPIRKMLELIDGYGVLDS